MVSGMWKWSLFLFMALGATATFFSAPSRAAENQKTERPPNIVFIFSDDHACQAIGAYGSKVNRTPHIDRLAQEGMVFRNSFCTNSICAPSRAVVLTGKHSHLNGQINNAVRFDGSQQTFPKLLRSAGYQTALVGKWHLKTDPTGFDHWEVLPGQGEYYNPSFLCATGEDHYPGYVTDIITDLALDWLKNRRDQERPFLLMCQHKAPHRSWMPGPDHLTAYDDVEIPEPPNLFDDYAGRSKAATMQELTIANDMHLAYDLKVSPPEEDNETDKKLWEGTYGRLTTEQRQLWDSAYGPKNKAFREAGLTGKDLVRWKYQRYVKDYLRCIASVDDNVGRLLDYLDQAGLSDNTVVIYSADQGFYLGEHGWFDKRWMYEESLRMPFIIRWPGVVKPGSVDGHLVQNLDYAETFLDMAGVEVPEDMQGRSLVPLLKGADPEDWRKSIYYHYYEHPGAHSVPRHYGVRTDRYKLIHFYHLGEWELYDLAKDPNEMKSVYDDPAYADVVKEMKAELGRLRDLYQVPDDPLPEQKR